MGSTGEICQAHHAVGPATVLAIGTANPSNFLYQTDFPDFVFKNTKKDHMTELKEKFKRICEKSTIIKRHIHLTEDLIAENPKLCDPEAPSLDTRQDIMITENAICGQQGDQRLRLGDDYYIRCVGLKVVYVSRSAAYQTPWPFSHRPACDDVSSRLLWWWSVLRIVKDLAENNKGARVLVVCSELNSISGFKGPNDGGLHSLLGQAIFADEAAAVIVGADRDTSIEHLFFQLISTGTRILSNSEEMVAGHLRQAGLSISLSKHVAKTIVGNLGKCLLEALNKVDITNWNSIFWVSHPGGPAILALIETTLGLKEEKLKASRKVLIEYGNMSSPTVLFILDQMLKKSMEEGKATTGDGFDWGVLLGFGPDLTVETILLRSVPTVSTP